MSRLAYFVAFWLLLVGCAGLVRSRNLVHSVVCLSVSQSGTYVLLAAIGFQYRALPPVYGSPAMVPTTHVVDPLVQALILTDIVVSATVTALLLAISIQIAKRANTDVPDKLHAVEG